MGESGNSDRFYFLGLQNHYWWYCSHKIKRHLLLKGKADKPRLHIKRRDTTLLTKVSTVKAMVFPVLILYGCDSWTIKKVARQRIDAFKLCWRRLLRVSWTARRSNQSVLKEINPEYSLEQLILNLRLQCFGYLMQRANSLEKTLMLGKIKGKRREGWQKTRWLDSNSNSMDMNLSNFQEIVKDGEAWHATVHEAFELLRI